MPRRWLTLVLFALTLAVQAIAPAASGVVARDVGLQEICLKATDHAPQQAPGETHRRHDCALCLSFCDGAAPVAPRVVSLAAGPVHWRRLAWSAPERALPTTPRDSAHRARAPPSFA